MRRLNFLVENPNRQNGGRGVKIKKISVGGEKIKNVL